MDSTVLKAGVVCTLLDFNVIEEVIDGDKLDTNEGDKPRKPASKPRRSKKASTTKRG